MLGDGYLQEHIELLLRRGFTGCQFVPRLINDDSLIISTFESVDLVAVDTFLRAVGEDDSVAMTIFPGVQSEAEFLQWLRDLDACDSWRVSEASKLPFRIHVEWATNEQKWSSCMGFAPFLEMPLPRRLPCVGMVLWPGQQTRSDSESVNFQDIKTGLKPSQQKELRAATRERVGELFKIEPDVWREVTFGLPDRHRQLLGS